MKRRFIIFLQVGLLALAVNSMAAPLDFTQAIHCMLPTNFYSSLIEGGPHGDNPFFADGRTFLEYKDKNDKYGLLDFQFGLVGAYIGEGKVVKFLPITSASLKAEMESVYSGTLTNSTSVETGEISGLTSVGLTTVRPSGSIRPYFLHFCWVQIETNTVLKIIAYSCDAESFKTMTNALQSLKIDKPKLVELLHSTAEREKP